MSDIIIVGLVIVACVWIIYKTYKDRKSGKSSCGCGCGCDSCSTCGHEHEAH